MYDSRFKKQKVGIRDVGILSGLFGTLFVALIAICIRLAFIALMLYGAFLLLTDPGVIGRTAGTIAHEFSKQVNKKD